METLNRRKWSRRSSSPPSTGADLGHKRKESEHRSASVQTCVPRSTFGNTHKVFDRLAATKLICRRGDSNPHELPHTALNRARLPVPPLRQVGQTFLSVSVGKEPLSK